MKQKKQRWKWYEILLMAALLGMSLCCIAWLILYLKQMEDAKKQFDNLSQNVYERMEKTELDFTWESKETWIQESTDYLKEKNSDCVGWLQIEGTTVDYPIMYTPNDQEYYLRRNFERQYSLSGTPFLDVRCDIQRSTNLIIYGHNMKNGSMFAPLEKYIEKDYGLKHQKIKLYYDGIEKTYALMAVLHFEVQFENLNDYYFVPTQEQEFDKYIERLEKESLYCGGDKAIWGEQLITLSTCDNKTKNGRILVVAREETKNGLNVRESIQTVKIE